MKHTEQRWMHISTGLLVERGRKPDNSANDYRTVTVTWDEPEWEEVDESPGWCVRFTDNDNPHNVVNAIFSTEYAAMAYAKECSTPTIVYKLRGTYRRRKPEPEVWEGPTKRSVSGDVAIIQHAGSV